MKISINIPFWFSNQDRLENLSVTHKSLTGLKQYLVDKGLDVTVRVFEFSKDKQYFTDSIYFPIGIEYGKSLKINTALKYLKENDKPDIVSFFDSDCFVDKKDWEKVYQTLVNFDKNRYYCNNLTKLDKNTYLNSETLELNTSFLMFRNSGLIRGLGGIWICDFDTLYSIGGFDETYIIWGKEDEDVGKRFDLKGLTFEQLNFRVYHLFHELHKSKTDKTLPEHKEQWLTLISDNSIVRKTLLNNYSC